MTKRNIDKLTLTGGYSTPADALWGLMNELVARYGFKDAEERTLLDAFKDPDETARRTGDSVNVSFSAGVIPVFNTLVIPGRDRNEGLVAFNPVEARSVPELALGALRKSAALKRRAKKGPNAEEARQVDKTLLMETSDHLFGYVRLIPEIGKFSSTLAQAYASRSGVFFGRVDTTNDLFFGPYPDSPWDGASLVVDGEHDEPIVNSKGFVAKLPDDLFDRLRD